MARTAHVKRTTSETELELRLDLDGDPGGTIDSGHGFLDHMLQQLQRHGRLALELHARGDLHVDVHHLAEDCGIVLGQGLREALGDSVGIERYADAFVPMDETLAHVVVDLSGRAHLAFEPPDTAGDSNGFNPYHLRELLRGFCNHGGVTLHARVLAGRENHHVCEALVKAWARSLAEATRVTGSALPSTKGLL